MNGPGKMEIHRRKQRQEHGLMMPETLLLQKGGGLLQRKKKEKNSPTKRKGLKRGGTLEAAGSRRDRVRKGARSLTLTSAMP